jgi:hypothetical protein
MIRKAIIVILSIASAATGVFAALTFTDWVKEQQPWEPVDTRDTLVMVYAERGSLLVAMSRSRIRPTRPRAESADTKYVVDFRPERLMRRMILLNRVSSSPTFLNWSSATRFGLALPSWEAKSIWVGNVGFFLFPLWCPLVLFSIYPAVAFIRGPVRRWRRRRHGLCLRCGYNLTGLTEPRCPECGEQVPCTGSGE